MMKINSFNLKQNEEGKWEIIGRQGTDKFSICVIDDLNGNPTAQELKERALDVLRDRDIEIVDDETIFYMQDQKLDLSAIRTEMRMILRKLGGDTLSHKEKMDMIPVIQQMCSTSQVIINACKLELEFDKQVAATRKVGKR